MNYLLLASALLGAMHMTNALGFGGGSSGCGCAPPAPPPCPPPCPPPPPACPPPPPPPPPPPVCPAPSPCGGGGGPPLPPPVCQPPIPWCAPPPVQNSCATGPSGPGAVVIGTSGGGGCGGGPAVGPRCGCRTHRRKTTTRVTRDTEVHEVTQISESTEDDVLCNNEDLRKIILNNLTEDPELSKVQIHDAANAKLGGHFAVICTNENFSYIADSKVYCLDANAVVSCYAFQV